MPKAMQGGLPVLILALGGLGLLRVGAQQEMPLRSPLSAEVPTAIGPYVAREMKISEDEQRVAGMDTYVLRVFSDSTAGGKVPAFSVYVGYYRAQSRGRTIHSPKNCLPGGGWEPVTAGSTTLDAAGKAVTVNRYLIQKGKSRAVVYYWYQGRGRTSWNEYQVKWELLRDKASHRRSEEALVRVVVPVTGPGQQNPDSLAREIAIRLTQDVERALPAFP